MDAWSGYDNWLTTDPRKYHEDWCNCEMCHEIHVEEQIFLEGCCADQKCLNCNGTGLQPTKEECPFCSEGRV